MSGLDPNAGGALVVPGGGGTSLPTASGAGELPVSDGAGSAYTATSAGDVLALGMVAALTGEPAGAALIGDGAGGIDVTSADVSAMLAAANAAAARAALGVTAPTRYGNQPGGDTAWAGWTLGSGCVLTAGALRLTSASSGTQVLLAALASGRAVRVEWLVKPISGWDSDADIVYLGLARSALSQYWLHRCRGDDYMSAWIEQAVTDLQPGVEIASGGPTIADPTIWMALEISGGRVRYEYGTGTGTSGRTPPAPGEWKVYGDYLASTYTGLASVLAEDRILVLAEGTCVVDLDALTIIPLSPVVS